MCPWQKGRHTKISSGKKLLKEWARKAYKVIFAIDFLIDSTWCLLTLFHLIFIVVFNVFWFEFTIEQI